eukprot:scaffold1280_cov379-Prasinococcus_capsulatus_cf.AAC.22
MTLNGEATQEGEGVALPTAAALAAAAPQHRPEAEGGRARPVSHPRASQHCRLAACAAPRGLLIPPPSPRATAPRIH